MKHIAFLSVKWMSVGLGMLSLLLSVASCGDKEYGDAMNEAQLMNRGKCRFITTFGCRNGFCFRL